MYRRTTHGNRLGLALTAALLMAAGIGIILVNQGAFGTTGASTRIYPQPAAGWVDGHRWIFWVLAVVALVVVLVAVRWLLVQLRTDRVRTVLMDSESDHAPGSGRTSMAAAAVTDAITEQAEAITGVRRATADLTGARDAPELWMTVVVSENADVGRIRRLLQSTVAADVRRALEMPALAIYLTLKVSKRSTARQVV